ncbi:hypothetical protein [Winogradskyella sediminis]|uniref:hypothetical protein n=1 Tax=Winogradskyella sediminis TaxID=1382466 RepID=UPI000E233D29|nr:hypothetical protein [Winogradskyella sediminis]REG87258.1 hypothetical protein C8N41_10293 [Winogradskyella sediminis]
MKNFTVLILVFVSFSSYSQGITFQKNTNTAAQKFNLVQKLNKSGDSLILATDHKKIKQVDILNYEYLETFEINNSNAKIGLSHLYIGNYVVQARIGRHWIVMYLEKRDLKAEGLKTTDGNINSNVKEIVTKNSISSVSSTIDTSNLLQLNENKMYWVVYESNTQFASHRNMGLKYADEIYDLINQIELEMKSEVAKANTLRVYEVFDKSEFMRKQLKNKNYHKRKSSKLFNVNPIYNSEDKRKSITSL